MTLPRDIGMDEPQLIPVTIIVVVYLIFSSFTELVSSLGSDFLPQILNSFSLDVMTFLDRFPIQYVLLLLTGMILLFTNHSRFLSRRRLAISAYLLIVSSVIIPLALYYSPLSVLIIFSLESLGFDQSLVSLVSGLIASALLIVFVLYPLITIGTEIFHKKDYRIILIGFLLFVLDTCVNFMDKGVYPFTSFIGSLDHTYNSLVVHFLPGLLFTLSFALMAVPFVNHLKNRGDSSNPNASSNP